MTAVVSYVAKVNDAMHIHLADGTTAVCVPTTTGVWLPTVGVPVTTPAPPTPPPSTTVQNSLVAWMVAHIGVYAYSQASGRLTPDTSGYTDCSGLTYYCYKTVTGQNIGTWTGTQNTHGTAIVSGSGAVPEAQLVIGDLIFYNWSYYKSSYDHVDMYTGPNQAIGHGGPGRGPTYKNNLASRTAYAHDWKVCRYV